MAVEHLHRFAAFVRQAADASNFDERGFHVAPFNEPVLFKGQEILRVADEQPAPAAKISAPYGRAASFRDNLKALASSGNAAQGVDIGRGPSHRVYLSKTAKSYGIPAVFAIALTACTPSIVLPPPQYDHEPTRPFQDIRMPYWTINNACRTFGDMPRGRVEACVISGRVPLRIVPNDVDPATLAALIRHENGHLAGWPKDHPGGRF